MTPKIKWLLPLLLFYSSTILALTEADTTGTKLTDEVYAWAWNYPDTGLIVAQGYIERSRAIGDHQNEAHGYIFMADCYIMKGDFAPAIKNLLTARKICDDHGITYLDQRINRPYGKIFIELGNPIRAIKHQKEALTQTDEQLEIAITLHSLSEAYLEADSLIAAASIAEDLYSRAGNLWNAIPHVLGRIYLKMGNHEKALEVFKTKSNLTYDLDYLGNLIGQADAHLALGNLDSARTIALQGLEMSQERGFKKYVYHSAGTLAESYKDLDLEKYIYYNDLSRTAYENMYGKEKMSDFQDFILSDQERQRKNAEEALTFKSKQRSIILSGISFSLLLLGGFLWRSNRIKTRARNLMSIEKEKVEKAIIELKSTQEKLIQAEKTALALERKEGERLRELDSFKTRLYTNLTHEFRTPLTVIMGMNENIEGFEHERKLIKRNAKNLLRLINQLLDMSKLDSGNLKVKPIQGDIVAFLKYVTQSFYSLASEKKINLQFQSTSEEIILDFDEEKIQHILYNLISNAIKYTKPGGKVGVEVLEENNQLLIKVIDTGIGIEESEIPKIFDRFYQVEGDRSVLGTGIGLSFTKELVELLNGQINVKSKKYWGTEVIVSLPVIKTVATQIKSYDYDVSLIDHNPPSSSIFEDLPPMVDQVENDKPLVLIAEDNEGVVDYLKAILTEEYNVLIAVNGQEGIDLAQERIPDIVITDVMMPEKNGYQLCHTLKNDERTSHIPVIMLTAKADIDSKIEGLETGADAYLEKPFEKKELIVRIRKLLDLRAQLQSFYSENSNADHVQDHPPHINRREIEFLDKIKSFVEHNLEQVDFSLIEMSKKLLMSHTQLYRKLKAITGKTPSQYVRGIRLDKAMEKLKNSDLSISEIAYAVGFNDPNYFSRVFKQEYNMTPNEIRG